MPADRTETFGGMTIEIFSLGTGVCDARVIDATGRVVRGIRAFTVSEAVRSAKEEIARLSCDDAPAWGCRP